MLCLCVCRCFQSTKKKETPTTNTVESNRMNATIDNTRPTAAQMPRLILSYLPHSNDEQSLLGRYRTRRSLSTSWVDTYRLWVPICSDHRHQRVDNTGKTGTGMSIDIEMYAENGKLTRIPWSVFSKHWFEWSVIKLEVFSVSILKECKRSCFFSIDVARSRSYR